MIRVTIIIKAMQLLHDKFYYIWGNIITENTNVERIIYIYIYKHLAILHSNMDQ